MCAWAASLALIRIVTCIFAFHFVLRDSIVSQTTKAGPIPVRYRTITSSCFRLPYFRFSKRCTNHSISSSSSSSTSSGFMLPMCATCRESVSVCVLYRKCTSLPAKCAGKAWSGHSRQVSSTFVITNHLSFAFPIDASVCQYAGETSTFERQGCSCCG